MAPDLTGGLAWLNTDKPISLRDLRGNVVILDFWTAGCVNCMHMLAVLAALEAKRAGQPLQIIGVHSAKFDSDKDPSRVLASVERYGVDHPVVVDRNMAIWERYGIEAWPTLVVIRPDGQVAGAIPGEVSLEELDAIVGKALDEARANGTLAKGPLLSHTARDHKGGALSFPGKVLAARDGRIFISDSGHHRVLVTSPAGRILQVVGSGEAGQTDGPFATARMVEPQGLALDEDRERLYIADARGQRVRVADLRHKTLSTLAGTGEIGREPIRPIPLPAKTVALRTPWDLALRGGTLYVALAGSHQLGVIDLTSGTLRRFAGTGREDLTDGRADESAFAQPSGLALAGNLLYVADAEASAIRTVDLKDGSTHTLLGTGLFDWGDADGALRPKMLQHPLAVANSPGGLWIADTYNRKIKRLTESVPGKGFDTLLTVAARAANEPLANPSGLAVEVDGSLLVADTDRHRLLRIPAGAKEPLVVPVSERVAAASVVPAAIGAAPLRGPGEEVAIPPQVLPPGPQRLPLGLVAPEGYAFSEGAPWSVEVTADGDAILVDEPKREGEATSGKGVDLDLAVRASAGKAELLIAVRATICDEVKHSACYPRRLRFRAPIVVDAGAMPAAHAVKLALTPPVVGTTSRR
jgi:sugar lactone lactonase YvrE